MLDRKVKVRYCLGLDALGGIHNKKGALARGYRPRDFVREVDVARSIDKIKRICLSVMDIIHLDGVALDRDALLLLQIHGVQDLVLHVTLGKCVRYFKHPVGQGALAVVDMRNDAKVSCVFHRLYIIGAKIINIEKISLFLFNP